MSFSLDQIVPSLSSLGLWSYWIIGAVSMLEAFVATGLFVPGTVIVEAGGLLVQQGVIDYFDLVWFVAIGSILGGEASYWTGQLARKGLATRWTPEKSRGYQRAVDLFERRGGFAIVLGRFLGPVSGFVALAASMAGMDRRRFLRWNILSGFPFAFAHVSLGYLLGDVASSLGPLISRYGLLALAVVLAIVVLWWLVIRVIRLLPFVVSILKSVWRGILENEEVVRWKESHPRLSTFLSHRFDTDAFSGLTATFLTGAALYLFVIWVGSVFNFLMFDSLVQADIRLANLIHAFWSPDLLRIAVHVTGLGDWKVVTPLALALSVIVVLWRRNDLLLGMGVALAGDLVSVNLLKRIFDRPRSELGYFVETSSSFPSGHAAISVAFYGFVFFVLWRLKVLKALPAAMAAVTLAFFLGFSRIYLIEHYLSDVINGWLVGGIWMIAGIAAAEWWQETRKPSSVSMSQPGKLVAVGAVTALLAIAIWQDVVYDKEREVDVKQSGDIVITSVVSLFGPAGLQPHTESVTGTPLEPINLIVLAKDEQDFASVMNDAGWISAGPPSIASLSRAALSAWTNGPDENAPVTPYFWQNIPNTAAFEKATPDGTIRKRHHVRFWRTDYVTPDGLRMFVGAASFDDGLDWGLLHHIDPNIDSERDTLASDLQSTGRVTNTSSVRLSEPQLGQSVAGDPWFSDGLAHVLTIR